MNAEEARNQLRRRNGFQNAVKHLLQEEYRFLGGQRIQDLFVTDLVQLQDQFLVDASRLDAGQVLWWAVDKEDKPKRAKTIEETRMVPVILTLATTSDVEAIVEGHTRAEIRRERIARLLREAYEQGGVLALSDVALLTGTESKTVSNHVRAYQDENGVILPYRGTVHDMGRALTHKRVIVGLFLENVPTPEIARRTRHSLESCDRYIKAFKRVRKLYGNGMPPENIAAELDMSPSLVNEYIDLIVKHQPDQQENRGAEAS